MAGMREKVADLRASVEDLAEAHYLNKVAIAERALEQAVDLLEALVEFIENEEV